MIVPSGIIFHNGLSVPRGLVALRASVFRATCFLVLLIVVVLSPNVIISLSGVILIGDVYLRFAAFFLTFWRVELSEAESSSGVSSLNLISSSGSESVSIFHKDSAFNIGCLRSLFLSK